MIYLYIKNSGLIYFPSSPLDNDEVFDALQDMEDGKSLGTDGLSFEFHRELWFVVCDDLLMVVFNNLFVLIENC